MRSITKRSNLSVVSLVMIVLAFAVLAIGLTSCTPKKDNPNPPGGQSQSPIKIGAIFSVTGQQAPLGEPEKETALLIGAQFSGEEGIDGRPVQIIVEDDKGQEAEAVKLAKKLTDEGVIAIVGPTITGTSMALKAEMSKSEVPLVSCAAGIPIVDPVDPWVFKTAQSDAHAVAKLIDYMKTKGIKKVAMINDSNPFGMSGKDQLDKQAPAAGITIVASEKFGTNDKDMTTQLTRIKGKNPDAVICWGTNPGPAVVTKNMKQLGMTMPLLQSHGIANKKYIEQSEGKAEGVIFPAGKLLVVDELPDSDPQKEVLIAYRDLYKAMYKKDPNTFGGHAWDAIQIVVKAVEKAGTDKAKLRDAIEETEGFVGIGGVFNFTDKDHNGLTKDAFVLVQIKDGKWTLVK